MEATVNRSIQIFSDLEAAQLSAASHFLEIADKSINLRGRFSAAISGGSSPLGLFSILGSEYSADVQWENVHIFWVDERCVPPEHNKSNFRHAQELWLSKSVLPEENIHRIMGELDPIEGALRYEYDLRDTFNYAHFPVFDLILLGMGEDGHTASLFPGEASLSETCRIAIPVYIPQLRNWRITLTLPVLNHAHNIIFLVGGSAKSSVLSEVLEAPEKRELYPAGLVQPQRGMVTWLIDRTAASRLRNIS